MRFLESEDADDPILSVVNLVDVFLVMVGVLLVMLAANPLNPYQQAENVIVIENPGQADMRMTIKKGEELQRYESAGEVGEGMGAKAGTTYRLDDGRLIYVPEQEVTLPK